ncbi:HAD-IIB family hydrolase [Thiomicrospira microaerophila]|uniref:HAD-IIB family hydrolase n=1 Tax=Thiomicrospira microaerophila TaxID=406020 RepID=UPI00200C2ED4|nr:HAD-IIB family hydrolase [Thiomicrospira microaerophila]UQB42396.1 HAD-IIB family hydrolase [Thiomicrospira microaerophila]
MTSWLVSTDLDGTLLNHHSYEYKPVIPLIKQLQQAGVPLILNSSKTYAELIQWQQKLGLTDPIIAENGGIVVRHGQVLHQIGSSRADILALIHEWRQQQGWQFEGFADWSVQQLVEKTGLDHTSANLAMQRDVTEPIVWLGSPAGLVQFTQFLAQHHLQLQKGGRFYHVMAQHDKATALAQLIAADSPTRILALGDGGNDRAMLAMADVAVIMPNPQGGYLDLTAQNPNQVIYHAPQHAPQGWAQAVNHFIFQEAL